MSPNYMVIDDEGFVVGGGNTDSNDASREMLGLLKRLVDAHSQNNVGPDAERAFRQIAIEARAVIARAEARHV